MNFDGAVVRRIPYFARPTCNQPVVEQICGVGSAEIYIDVFVNAHHASVGNASTVIFKMILNLSFEDLALLYVVFTRQTDFVSSDYNSIYKLQAFRKSLKKKKEF